MIRGASRPALCADGVLAGRASLSVVAQASFRRRQLSLLALVVLVAGCGGGGGAGEDADRSQGPHPGAQEGAPSTSGDGAPPRATESRSGEDRRPAGPAAPTTAALGAEWTAADDEALARRIPLTVADLPPGYEQAPQPKRGAAAAEDPFEGCERSGVGVLREERARWQSPVFSKAEDAALLSVGSAVAVYPSVEAAGRAFEAIGPGGAGSCLAEFVKRQAGADPEAPKVGEPSVVTLAFSNLGHASAALRVTLELAAEGGAVPLVTDFVFIRSGRAMATVAFSGVGEPFPLDQAEAIVARVVERM